MQAGMAGRSAPASGDVITFMVRGIPQQKGSFRPVVLKNGKAALVPMNAKAKPWQAVVGSELRDAMVRGALETLRGPVGVELDFTLPAPATLPKERLGWPACKSKDIDKLARTVLDAMAGVAFSDDGQVCVLTVRRRYENAARGFWTGMTARVWLLGCEHRVIKKGVCRDCDKRLLIHGVP